VPKLNRQRSGSTAIRAARVILGASLLLSIVSVNIPTALVASSPMCTLACCAGKAPHSAGSCMNGSCRAFLNGRAKTLHVHRQLPVQQSEQLCGLPRRGAWTTSRLLIKSSPVTVGDSSRQSGEAENVSTSTLGKPCQQDCGAGTLSSSSQSRPRDTGAISYADKPRPPSSGRLERSTFNRANALDTLCRRSRPRGPPITSS
jgi:hypothetical protein